MNKVVRLNFEFLLPKVVPSQVDEQISLVAR
jgi:hypothetical protein